MQYTQLGRTGTRASRLALCTMNFGWHTDEERYRLGGDLGGDRAAGP